MPGKLYLVATPIGNLQDISFRALDVMRNVDIIACEDTRHTLKLLNHFRIANRLVSYHEHNELERSDELADRLLKGESIAIVSDAGTPGICDPGSRIVRRAIEIGVEIVSIPGAAAFVAAAIVSGLPTESIFFGGFLPSKKGERRRRLEEVHSIPATLVFYETPHRLGRSLSDCADVLGDRQAAIVRELTKLHEEIARGSLPELARRFAEKSVKGEIVLAISRATVEPKEKPTVKLLSQRVRALEKEGADHKSALKKAAKEFGLSKSEAYRLIKFKSEKVKK